MKLKICGMKYNIKEVAALQPDYLGFIFWKPSKRFFEGTIPPLPAQTKKIGVFVDAPIKEVFEKANTYSLYGVQLHGKESPEYCKKLKPTEFAIIKVFSMVNDFDFSVLREYEDVCDYFLFDTQGKLPGGNGYIFDWSVLKNYCSTKPYFLSGGIGPEEVEQLRSFFKSPESGYCHAIDINSRFELRPGLKNTDTLKEFKKLLRYELSR
ncbi:MAG: phosphoribosylanthranilate isomerase [Bacteroidota bacterium]